MTEQRSCPPCEEGKHATCIEEVLGPDDPPGTLNFVPCPCMEREHIPLVHLVPVDEAEDEWQYKDIITGKEE